MDKTHEVSMVLQKISANEEGFKIQLKNILLYLLVEPYPWKEFNRETVEIGGNTKETFTTFTKYLDKWSRFTVDDLRKLFADDTVVLDLIDAATQGKHGGDRKSENIKVDNVHVDSKEERPAGNSSAAGLRRLRKSRPDLHEQVLHDDLTVNAAMIQAGFRKKYYQVEATAEAVKAFCKKHGLSVVTDDYRDAFGKNGVAVARSRKQEKAAFKLVSDTEL